MHFATKGYTEYLQIILGIKKPYLEWHFEGTENPIYLGPNAIYKWILSSEVSEKIAGTWILFVIHIKRLASSVSAYSHTMQYSNMEDTHAKMAAWNLS